MLGTHSEVVSEIVENSFERKRLKEKVLHLSRREKKVLKLRFGLEDEDQLYQSQALRQPGLLCGALTWA